MPLPTNTANNSSSGFFTGPTSQNEYLAKYDESLSDRDHVAASYFYLRTAQNAYAGGSIPYATTQSFGTQQVLNLSDVHTMNPATANQAWITFTRVVGGRTNLPTVRDVMELNVCRTANGCAFAG